MEKSVDLQIDGNGVVQETKDLNKCPYSQSTATVVDRQTYLREDYDLQYNEDHEVVKVKVGTTDIHKEIMSNIDKVGLVNVMKNAIAHGQNPNTIFAKTENGIPFAIDPDATLDDLIAASNQNEAKLTEIAATLGVKVDDLRRAFNEGKMQDFVANALAKKEVTVGTKEGGAA